MADMSNNAFSVIDYIVLGVTILISVGIGAFFAYRDKNNYSTKSYFLGSQKLKTLPVCLSLVVTSQSSVLLIGIPAESYAYGMQAIIQILGLFVGFALATVIVIPVFHPLKVTTVYEYYNLRFGNNYVRIMALAFGTIYYTVYMGIVMYATGLALESAGGIPSWASILSLSLAAIIYTSIGGFKSVIWTDVFQSIIMFTGILTVLIKTSIKAGGTTEVMKISRNRLNFFDFNTDPTIRHTFWTLSTGGIMAGLYITISQSSIQRIQSTACISTAKRVFLIAGPVFALVGFLVMLQGLTMYAFYYTQGCDPLASGQISNVNQIVPFTIAKLFKGMPGLPGLFLAALAAASLSTISSCLTGISSMVYYDCIKLVSRHMPEKRETNIAKVMVVIFGIIAIGSSFMLSNIRGPLGQIMLATSSAITGPEIGLYLVCIFFRKTTTKGALFGFMAGFSFVLWICIGQVMVASISKPAYLPLGPIDKCHIISTNRSESEFFDSDIGVLSIPTTISSKWSTSTVYSPIRDSGISFNDTYYKHENISQETSTVAKKGLQKLYTLSYLHFNILGCIIDILVTIAVSLVTQPKDPADVNKATMLPLTALIPSCLNELYKKVCRKKKGRHDPFQEADHELLPNV